MNRQSGPPDAAERKLKALMLRGLDGDAGAHRELLTALAETLRPFIARRLGDFRDDADDLVQEVLIAVHTRRATFDRSQPFTAWAYAIARYKLIDFHRKRGVRLAQPLDDIGDIPSEGGAEAAVAAVDLRRLLAFLPGKQRRAIKLVKMAGFTSAEAAEMTGMSEAAVKVSVHRGLKALAARVRGDESDGH